MTEQYWGIDLGGTKIEGVVLGATDAPNPLCRIRVATEAQQGYEHIVERIVGLVQAMRAETATEPKRVGIGTPGVLDPQNSTMKNSNTTCLIDRPLQHDLETALGIPVELANDANCFALAEARLGAGRGAKTTFGVILGTGVGGGVVVGQKALYGCQGIAGEWGHNLLDPEGPECYCGRRGCVETILSGPFLERFYAERAKQRRPLPEIAERRGQDPDADATIERLTTYFGRAIANVINILDPDVVVLGGGVSNIDLLYNEGVRETARHVFNNRLETRIVKNELGDSAGVFGAAMLVA
ncbi:MAG TPA: ROK family protein [Candidatus Latescibacteria bacterium]|nr:ROK family protein [Candidatus Handelsmanbacteria bacterium]HIL11286.1 ROK family protein [Candidatus Latescibacterota bacterium]